MERYLVVGKLGGSFGGTEDYQVVYAIDEDAALDEACDIAKEVYSKYEGRYQLLAEHQCDSEEDYLEEVESWIDYGVIKKVDDKFVLEDWLEERL